MSGERLFAFPGPRVPNLDSSVLSTTNDTESVSSDAPHSLQMAKQGS
jgi:hypothetical protein